MKRNLKKEIQKLVKAEGKSLVVRHLVMEGVSAPVADRIARNCYPSEPKAISMRLEKAIDNIRAVVSRGA